MFSTRYTTLAKTHVSATQLTETLIYDGNRTEWSAIWFEITRVITKLHDRVAGDQFVNHECDFKPKIHDTKFYYQLIISILKSFSIKREFRAFTSVLKVRSKEKHKLS